MDTPQIIGSVVLFFVCLGMAWAGWQMFLQSRCTHNYVTSDYQGGIDLNIWQRFHCTKCGKNGLFSLIPGYIEKIERYEEALREIRDVARCSDGVEFYAMLADRALTGEK